MTSMPTPPRRGRVVIGVDTHKSVHAAAALDDFGAVLATGTFTADRTGYAELIEWARRLGHVLTFAIEGTGSYGAGLTAAVRRSDIGVVEVIRTDRHDRRCAVSQTSSTPKTPRAQYSVDTPAPPRKLPMAPWR
jgi:transposase